MSPSRSGPQRSVRLYGRILAYLLPYKLHLLFVLICNFLFIFFNTLSIWMVAPFLSTLFGGTAPGAGASAGQAPATGASPLDLNAFLKEQYLRWVDRPDPVESLQVICVVIFLTFFLKNLFQFAEAYLVSFVEQRVIKDLRDEIYAKVLGKPLRFFARYSTGNLISRVTNDVGALNVAVNRSFTKVIRDPLMIAAFVYLLMSISWRLTLFAGLVIPVTGFVIQRIGQSLRRKSRREQERVADLTNHLHETLGGVRVVQAFGQESREEERFRAKTQRHFKAVLRKVRLNRLSSPLSETLGVALMVGVLWFGGREVLAQKSLSPEDFVRFLIILFAILEPIKSLGALNNNVQIALAAAGRIFEVGDDPMQLPQKPDALAKRDLDGEIRYDGVSFRYEPDTDWILADLSFRVARRQRLALVGPSGAGKSTIANLLPRFYDVDQGAISIDGTDLRDLRLADLRRMIGIVSQEVLLFNESVSANIAYARPDATPAEIREAARLAHALDFIEELPEGFDTVVGERGFRLSGGQRQRISIARAVLLDPPILIFDEATSALDSESEKLIQEAMDRLLAERTVIMIAHRLSTILDCDRILLIEGGRLLDQGSHAELLERSERYRQICRLQFGSLSAT